MNPEPMKRLLSRIVLLLAVVMSGCGDLIGPDHHFSEEAIDYYLEVALGAEYGSASPVVRKWADDLAIRVQGDPSPADRSELDRVIDELNELRSGTRIGIAAPGAASNVAMHFAPESTFVDILPQYVPVNVGFFWFRFNGRNEIHAAVILIDNTDAIPQTVRNHLIREELTQALGLANDSPRFPESIFYAEYSSAPTEYSPLDREVIQIHDVSEIQPGMTETGARRALNP